MQALITGGAGFIGSNLADRLIGAGHHVTVLDNLSTGSLVNLAHLTGHPRFVFVEADVKDAELALHFAANPAEVVFHLAAQVDVRASVVDPVTDANTNIVGTINVAQAARTTGVRKVVLSSSGGSIYGSPQHFPVAEDHPIDPQSPYAVSKVSAELYLNAFSTLYGLQCTHLALANVYGPRQNPHGEAGVVAIFSEALLNGRPTTVFGDGGNTRDYVFVGDVADAFLAASSERGDRRRYNIGTGIQTTDRQLHALVAAAAQAPDEPGYLPRRLGDVRDSAIDATRARTELGWRPIIDLEIGIGQTVRYFATRGEASVPANHEPT